MRSLRGRLLFGTAAGTVAVLITAGTALYFTIRSTMWRAFDAALCEKATTLAAMIEQDADGIELEFTQADMAEFSRRQRPEYFQVWRADGTVIERSPSLSGGDLTRLSAEVTVLQALTLPDGRPGRMVMLPFTTRLDEDSSPPVEPGQLYLALARDVMVQQAALARLRLALAGIAAGATLLSVAILAWLVNVGLRPVQLLARRISTIDEQRLTERIDARAAPQELQPLVRRLNELLQRLEAAFVREKTMTADVAHELRTPLAGLRTTLEVALSRPRDADVYRRAMSDCVEVCRNTQQLIDKLLTLARLDAGTDTLRTAKTDIPALLQAAWELVQNKADERALELDWQLPSGLCMETDPDKLRLVVNNLFENAVDYADAGGCIRVLCEQTNGTIRVRVSNTGSRISEEDLTHIFDRFWRKDPARKQDDMHCGLGLPLCRLTTRSLGGTITADTQDGVFAINLVLPSSSPADLLSLSGKGGDRP